MDEDLNVAVARTFDGAENAKIVKEYYVDREWCPVAHYFYDHRRAKLKKLKEQNQRLVAEIADLEKALGK